MAIVTVDDALRAYEAGRSSVAFQALKRLAEGGDKSAYHMLGYLYDVGDGTRRSPAKAKHWYLRAYRAGNSTSAINIATMYRDAGRHRLEFAWYRRAAAMADGDARLEVAIRYLSGNGVRRNPKAAIQQIKATLRSRYVSPASLNKATKLLRQNQGRRRDF